MAYQERTFNIHRVEFADGATLSQICDLRGGCFGTIIVPSGSSAIAKTLQFVAVEGEEIRPTGKTLPSTDLLTAAKTLAAGANPMTSDEIREAGAIGYARLKLSAAVAGNTVIYLLWKS